MFLILSTFKNDKLFGKGLRLRPKRERLFKNGKWKATGHDNEFDFAMGPQNDLPISQKPSREELVIKFYKDRTKEVTVSNYESGRPEGHHTCFPCP